jgi:methionyl-tRNA synthetase
METVMGEISSMILDGTLCEDCGAAMPDRRAPGYPRKCNLCGGHVRGPLVRKVRCDQCGKRVKETGLQDHKRDAHG